ncbi:hypothetical protein [Paraburkholderia silvatlantica]|uniref:COG4648 family protein n=1 Tax=Paraburkholderia silvatlantica TaxID=321895 RepID=UPI003751A641
MTVLREHGPAEPASTGESNVAGGRARGKWRLLAGFAYPVVILCAWRWDSPRFVGLLLLVLLWMQRVAGTGALAATVRKLTPVDWAVAVTLNVASVAIVITNSEQLMRLYPSLVNLGLLVAFGATLAKGPSMVEKFARLTYPDPPAHIVRYTRRVTQLWCVFFTLNSMFSAWTAFAWPARAWSLYNGMLAYVIIGALLAGEFVWRKWIMLPRAARREAL